MMSGERQAERRKDTVTKTGSVAAARTPRNQQNRRREQVEGTLKEIEARQAKKSVPLQLKIAAGGTELVEAAVFSHQRRAWASASFLLFLLIDAGLLAALGVAFAAGFGMPIWLLKFLKKRRETKFLAAFPDAVDTIVRGIKAGLPLLDSMRIISVESPEPLRGEFQTIMETQAIGMPIGEACREALRADPGSRGQFLRHRHRDPVRRPAATCRKRLATSRACCATARR